MGKYEDIFERGFEDALDVFADPSSLGDTVRDIYEYVQDEDKDEEEDQ